jgi:hypothetical protein
VFWVDLGVAISISRFPSDENSTTTTTNIITTMPFVTNLHFHQPRYEYFPGQSDRGKRLNS